MMGCEQEGSTGVHLDSEVEWVKRMHLCIEGTIRIAYRKIEVFHLPSYSIHPPPCLMSVKLPMEPQLAAKRSVYLVLLLR